MSATREAEIRSTQAKGGCLIWISGRLDESFTPEKLLAAISGEFAVINMDGVRSITSFGVKQWLKAIQTLDLKYYAFTHCRPTIVSQFNMIAHFGGKGQLITFYAPYFCQPCKRSQEILLDIRTHSDILLSGTPPTFPCPDCQKTLEFDDLPDNYFFYVRSRPFPRLPSLIYRLIDGEDPATINADTIQAEEILRVRKDLAEEVTGIWLSGPLKDKAHFRRLLDGLEGYVVVMASEVRAFNEAGLSALRSLLVAPGVELYLARVPWALFLALLAHRTSEERVRIASLWFQARCPRCQTNIEREISGGALKEKGTESLHASCPRCQEKIPLADALPEGASDILSATLPAPVRAYLAGQSSPQSPGEDPPWAGSTLQSLKDLQESEGLLPEEDILPTIQGYQILSLIGRGGMGNIYLARHPMIGKQIALKVLKPEYAQNRESLLRFFREAQAVNEIRHENVIDIINFVHNPEKGECYILMEYLEGETLARAIQDGAPFETRRVGHIGLQLCSALQAAHKKGIIHRDLKPENIFLITRAGQKDFVKVLDFGLAKLQEGSGKSVSREGVAVGTPAYMSPEQAMSDPVDERADIYSLGILLYEMATRTLPYTAANMVEVMKKQVMAPLPPPSTRYPAVAPGLEEVIVRCLQKEREARYPSMSALAQDLASACELELGLYFGHHLARVRSAAPIDQIGDSQDTIPSFPVITLEEDDETPHTPTDFIEEQ